MKMFCSECGAQVVGNGKFCTNCGAQITINGAIASTSRPAKPPQPKLVSKSCMHRLEEEWRGKPQIAFAMVGMVAAFVGAFTLGPLFLSYLRGDPEYKMEKYMPSTGMLLFALAAIVIIAILMKVVVSKLKENYLRYLNYCRKEYLEVDENGIRGNNPSGKIDLCYEDISRVETIPNDQLTKFAVIKINVLKIMSRSGTSYSFYSFENALELFNAIRQQITYSANNPVRAVQAHKTAKQASSYDQDAIPTWKRVQMERAANEQKDVQMNSGEKANARKTAVAMPVADGREKCSACGCVQMAGRNVCWDCGAQFVR